MKRVLVAAPLLFAAASLFADKAQEPKPHIDALTATAAGGSVSVHFTLADAFASSNIIQSLESGLPTSVTYVVEIFRDRPRWFDESVGRSRIEVICTFNSLTREYLVNYRRDRKLVRSETFTKLDALTRRLTTIDEPGLFPIGRRKPYKLKVRVKADFMRGWLLHVIPWQVSTRWRETRVVDANPKVQVRR